MVLGGFSLIQLVAGFFGSFQLLSITEYGNKSNSEVNVPAFI